MENNLKIIKENSLNEEIIASDIADTDEIVSAIIDEKYVDSLAYNICDVQPIHGPTGAHFSVQYSTNPEITAVQQIDTVDTIVAADTTLYTLTINGINFSFTSGVGATVAQIVTGLVTEINVTETNGSVPVTAADNTTNLTLTADVAGTPFTTVNTGVGSTTVTTTTPNVVFVAESKSVKVLRNNIEVEDDAITNTGFTVEAIQDMQSQFGKNAISFISKAFAGVSNAAENAKLITKLDTWALDTTALTISDAKASEAIAFEVSQRVAEDIIKMNSITYRTLDASVILPHNVGAAFLALGSYFTDDAKEQGLFVGKQGRIKYYINPDSTSTDVYVLLNGNTPGNSSVIMSPYHHQLITVTDPDSGQKNVFNVNRYALTLNSLSTTGNEMVTKFAVS